MQGIIRTFKGAIATAAGIGAASSIVTKGHAAVENTYDPNGAPSFDFITPWAYFGVSVLVAPVIVAVIMLVTMSKDIGILVALVSVSWLLVGFSVFNELENPSATFLAVLISAYAAAGGALSWFTADER
ncbi:hypothetical protein KBZ10_15915 [Streptomyces sp. F63]|uniref:hypothetical protein n=1 Tax=Streptomyces sp. F63 TaxID=2824887 RepID=UPI001B384251|nr:hypothetical protein [Streptomyces sp. F63]MBQ0985978.1 hypothetical protein [Streptomyces sp. F63]